MPTCPDCGEYVPGYYDGPIGHLWTNHYRERHDPTFASEAGRDD